MAFFAIQPLVYLAARIQNWVLPSVGAIKVQTALHNMKQITGFPAKIW
jgi:hypothetical protein